MFAYQQEQRKNSSGFSAHTCPGREDHHPLEEHLHKVAEMAEEFAASFGSGDWVRTAGLWHDLGKYHPGFQDYLRQDPEAHLQDEKPPKKKRGVNHSLGGALHALDRFGTKDCGRILAYLIACHHTGLTDWRAGGTPGKTPLGNRLEDETEKKLFEEVSRQPIPDDIRHAPLPASRPPEGIDRDFGLSLWIRMLFSCLVDADFLDTEDYMDEDRSANRGRYPAPEELREKLDRSFHERDLKLKQEGKSDTELNKIRAGILEQCRQKALEKPGLFSLTVPTGGGKTLSSMAFALDHAIKHGKKRIIYVIPYTSIIEQNAKVFKDVFGEENVIEHHSNFDHGEGETARSRLACENWDAPVIVTTNVQFFESLFAARTSRVRKLHNIVNSVVILDEAQLLPVEFLKPVLKAIDQLTAVYKTTLVFCTATQPALTNENPALKSFGLEKKNVREIIDEPGKLAQKLERVTVHPPADWNVKREWDDIAGELLEHERVLCIVNRRADARELYMKLKDRGAENGLYHLSALMCPAHRTKVIEEIKHKLADENHTAPIRVVSTQLIEAGVDIDFPVVYRALAGLDSIAQAAGRCNREGKLGPKGGKVKVFAPTTEPPPGILRKAATAGKEVIGIESKQGGSYLTPAAFTRFFERLYYVANTLDSKGILNDLKDQGQCEFQFLSAASNFRLIEEGEQVAIIAPYGEAKNILAELKKSREQKIDRKLLRRLQPYTVSIYKREFEEMKKAGKIISVLTEEFGPYTVQEQKQYRENIGLDAGAFPLFMD